jgi:mRNA-degrading endonuclease RelE of RelBE toxin-antitoxin system
VSYSIRLSSRAAKDLDRLDRGTRERILNRLDQLAEAPGDPRLSSLLTNQGDLRKSAWEAGGLFFR